MDRVDNADERIRKLEAEVLRFQQILQCAPDFVSLVTPEGRFLYINRLPPGVRLEDVVGTSMFSQIRPQHQELSRKAMQRAVATRKVQQYSTAGQITQNRVGHFFTRVSPIVENDVVTALVMIATEISSVEEQRVLLQVALDSRGLGTWSCYPNLATAVWDDTSRQILGLALDAECSVDRFLYEHVHPEDRNSVANALMRAFSSGKYGPLEHRVILAGGEQRWVAASALATRDSNGLVLSLVGSLQDVTERKALETRLLQAQRLESVGRLAGGIAHDFNNLLTAILVNADFATQAESLGEVGPMLDAIRDAAERGAALTNQLLAFARRQMLAPKVVDPNVIVARLEQVFKRTLGERIRTRLSLAATGHVRVDETQFEQLLINLVTNARDAMPKGGLLTVETLDVEFDAVHSADQPDGAAGPYIVIAMTDTGPGLEPEQLPAIFEPFNETRSVRKGLGLATCYGIAKQSGGHISVSSELGRGTTFKVCLPRVAEAPLTRTSPHTPANAITGERILFVEDDAVVRAVIERTLVKHGYLVSSAASAEAALRVVSATAPFDLLVTDVILPGMDGQHLAEQLRTESPSLRVLFMSGYSENAAEDGREADPAIHFLQKPFLSDGLLMAIRRALGG